MVYNMQHNYRPAKFVIMTGLLCIIQHFVLHSPSAAFAADDATRGSTTDARKATVLMTGFSDWLKGTGW